MTTYQSLIESKKVLKRKRIDGYAVVYYEVETKVLVQIGTMELDTYPDLVTAEKMANAFIKSYKDIVSETNR